MTTPTTTSPTPATKRGRWPLVVGLVVAAAAVVVFLTVLLPTMRRGGRIDALSESLDKPYKELVESDDPELNDALAKRLHDASRPWKNRVGIANVLMRRDRSSVVFDAMRTGDLEVRTVALAALQRHPSFGKQVAPDPAMRVNETIVAWLGRADDPTRRRAIEIAMARRPKEALPSIRAIAGSEKEPPEMRRTAIGALQAYVDCDAVATLQKVALHDRDAGVRLGAIQALDILARYRGGPCAAVLSEATVREAVAAGLAHPGDERDDRLLRRGVISLMKKTPSLAEGQLEALRARLAPTVDLSERRDALDALASLGDAKVLADLPRYVHDADEGIRHSAAGAVARIRDTEKFRPFATLLVGYVRDEKAPSGASAFTDALLRLRGDAGSWVGFPPRPRETPSRAAPAERELVKALFEKGEAQGVTRAGVADAWYRHYAKQAGLDPAGVDAVVATRDAFWAKARGGDAAGARALLDADANAKAHPALFLYERGWLDARGGASG
jgi:HEAT repeat protein